MISDEELQKLKSQDDEIAKEYDRILKRKELLDETSLRSIKPDLHEPFFLGETYRVCPFCGTRLKETFLWKNEHSLNYYECPENDYEYVEELI